MPRIAGLIVSGYSHHIIQCGNRRQDVLFSDANKLVYINYLYTYAKEAGIFFLGYCLMNNYVHLIAVPEKEESLALVLGEAP
ncbi:MAG: transposase [Candidatus Omnitrophica bacterium]|nr:transposase [Candidatus Omnitrophota bacterium]